MGFSIRNILAIGSRYEEIPGELTSRISSITPFVGNESEHNNHNAYSPRTIFFQIVVLQVFYYITTTILLYLLSLLIGSEFKLEWILSWKVISIENTLGLTIIGVWLLGSFFCVIFMTVIVGRSKLAWDFAITVHCINLVVVWIYTKEFPKSLTWWLAQLASCVILVSLGTWTSRWHELRDSFFEGIADTDNSSRQQIEMLDRTELVEEV